MIEILAATILFQSALLFYFAWNYKSNKKTIVPGQIWILPSRGKIYIKEKSNLCGIGYSYTSITGKEGLFGWASEQELAGVVLPVIDKDTEEYHKFQEYLKLEKP